MQNDSLKLAMEENNFIQNKNIDTSLEIRKGLGFSFKDLDLFKLYSVCYFCLGIWGILQFLIILFPLVFIVPVPHQLIDAYFLTDESMEGIMHIIMGIVAIFLSYQGFRNVQGLFNKDRRSVYMWGMLIALSWAVILWNIYYLFYSPYADGYNGVQFDNNFNLILISLNMIFPSFVTYKYLKIL